jgi:hypothetical protein
VLQGLGLRFAPGVVRRQLAGPLGEKGHLSVAVGDILIPFAGEKRQRIGRLQGEHRNDRAFDGERGEPGATADLGAMRAATADATRAVRRGIAREEFSQAGDEIDAPMRAQPGNLRVRGGCDAHGEFRRLAHGRVDFVDPPGARIGKRVERRHVGFDVEDRGAVDEIAGAEDQSASLDGEERHRRQAEGIGPVGRTRGEDAAALDGTARREHERAPALVAMKPPQQPHPFETREIAQGVLVAAVGEELQCVARFRRCGRLVPGLEFHLLPGAEKADGWEGQRRGQAAKKPRS